MGWCMGRMSRTFCLDASVSWSRMALSLAIASWRCVMSAWRASSCAVRLARSGSGCTRQGQDTHGMLGRAACRTSHSYAGSDLSAACTACSCGMRRRQNELMGPGNCRGRARHSTWEHTSLPLQSLQWAHQWACLRLCCPPRCWLAPVNTDTHAPRQAAGSAPSAL